MYPHIHPATRQAKVNPDNPNYYEFPNFWKTKPIEVIINPGELLYLPAFYFHHVRSLDSFSSSVNIYNNGPDKSVILDIILSIEKVPWLDIHASQKYRMGYIFIKNLIIRVLPDIKASEFITTLIESRYSHFNLDPFLTKADDIFSIQITLIEKFFLYIGLKGRVFCPFELSYAPDDTILEMVRPNLEKTAPLFLQLHEDIRQLILADFIETFTDKLVGPEDVGTFLYDCIGSKYD